MILRKPLGEITYEDLVTLCESRVRESSELEFKGALPFQPVKGQSATADRWVMRGDRVGEYARDKLLAELVAFANTEGGTLILGIKETDDEPRRAETPQPLPRCEDLARRLADACEDLIEPRLPILGARALPQAMGDGSGVVVMRVGRSAIGPHRLTSTGQFYIRRGERSVKMTVREIKDAVLEFARRGDVLAKTLRHYRLQDRLAVGKASAASQPTGAHVRLLRATAFPTAALPISNLTSRPQLWWRGDDHEAIIDGGPKRLGFPAWAFREHPRVALRQLWYADGEFRRSLTAEAIVSAELLDVRTAGEGKVLPPTSRLHWDQMLSLICGVLAQVEYLRRALAADGAEFGMQIGVEANVELMPSFYEGSSGRSGWFRSVEFPTFSVGHVDDFDDLVVSTLRDIANHCGSSFDHRVEVDWPRLVG